MKKGTLPSSCVVIFHTIITIVIFSIIKDTNAGTTANSVPKYCWWIPIATVRSAVSVAPSLYAVSIRIRSVRYYGSLLHPSVLLMGSVSLFVAVVNDINVRVGLDCSTTSMVPIDTKIKIVQNSE